MPATSPFSLYVSCGASAGFTDASGREWQADTYYTTESGIWVGSSNDGAAWSNTTADLFPLYNQNIYNARYTLPVPSTGTYELTLFYAEMYWTQADKRVFNVEAQGVLAVSALDLIAVTGHRYSAYTTVNTVSVTAAGLNVSLVFMAILDNAMVSGIALIQRS